jgi:ketosteroid isomerase-like protein
MSQENVEVVRRFWAATTRRDLEAMDELIAEDAEFRSVLAASEGGVFRGHQSSREYFAAIVGRSSCR